MIWQFWEYIEKNGGEDYFLIDGLVKKFRWVHNSTRYVRRFGGELTYTNWMPERTIHEYSSIIMGIDATGVKGWRTLTEEERNQKWKTICEAPSKWLNYRSGYLIWQFLVC